MQPNVRGEATEVSGIAFPGTCALGLRCMRRCLSLTTLTDLLRQGVIDLQPRDVRLKEDVGAGFPVQRPFDKSPGYVGFSGPAR